MSSPAVCLLGSLPPARLMLAPQSPRATHTPTACLRVVFYIRENKRAKIAILGCQAQHEPAHQGTVHLKHFQFPSRGTWTFDSGPWMLPETRVTQPWLPLPCWKWLPSPSGSIITKQLSANPNTHSMALGPFQPLGLCPPLPPSPLLSRSPHSPKSSISFHLSVSRHLPC